MLTDEECMLIFVGSEERGRQGSKRVIAVSPNPGIKGAPDFLLLIDNNLSLGNGEYGPFVPPMPERKPNGQNARVQRSSGGGGTSNQNNDLGSRQNAALDVGGTFSVNSCLIIRAF